MTAQNNIAKWFVRTGLFALLALPVSCGKSEKIDLNPNLNVANDIVISQRLVLNAFRLLVRAANNSGLLQTHHAFFDGASVTWTPGLKKYAFQYFGANTPDSVMRSGTIEAVLSGNLVDPGTRIGFSFTNYSEDAMHFTSTDTVENTGISGTDLTFSNSIPDGVVVKDTAGTIRFTADLHYTLPVNPTGGMSQAVIMVTGNFAGTSSRGHVFSSAISVPLVFPVFTSVCAYMRDGTVPFSITGHEGIAGTITFPPVQSCSDSVYYDFGGTVYRWRMKQNYLAH